jgi:acetyltransferase-like isoleucine patch superfamily enzyme
MAYLTESELQLMGFLHLGINIKVSDKASIYNCESISIGDNSRIDDFCILSGVINIGCYCHITPMCIVAGGVPGVILNDYSTLAYGVKIFAQSDDYSGATMVNSLVPKKYKNEIFHEIEVGKHVIIGAGSVVMPGASIATGCSIGAMTLVSQPTKEWGVYVGIPARRLKERKKDLLKLEQQFIKENTK